MKRTSRTLSLAAAALAAPFLLAAPPVAPAAENTVTLGVPVPATLRVTTDASQNAWAASNSAFVAETFFTAHAATSRVVAANSPKIVLASSDTGFPLERTVPAYYLGDQLVPPDNVDWPATYAAFTNSPDTSSFIFDSADSRVFVSAGGIHSFTWILTDGTPADMSYVISPACSGRPRRIYWTDAPWNAPSIDLSGKFVKFFGDPEILDCHTGTVTNWAGGIQQVVSNQIVRGLALDSATHLLSAHGTIQGQVVMVYYDTGNYERILHVQVVEVCRPSVNRLTGDIGRALQPDGRGYDVTGLRARPTVVSPSDGRGEYLYQHKGQHSYSPKNNFVYPLRPTVDCPWNAEIYWMETDEMEVEWPFELDQYACDWPADTTVFVRGDLDGDGGRPVYVPFGFTATLMDYQEPDGHARAVAPDGTFNAVSEGYSLLRLAADDDIWFFPLHAVFRSNTNYFTLAPDEARVGVELTVRGGSASGLAPGFVPAVDSASPGYVYLPASSPDWNPNLYKAPAPDPRRTGSDATNNVSSSGDVSDTNSYASVIYPVRARETNANIEVWWNTTLSESGMSEPLVVPTLPQVYSVRWPEPGETPQIVIASQLGSDSESLFSHNASLYLAQSDSSAALSARSYFDDNDGGTLMFWARSDGETGGDSSRRALLTLANYAAEEEDGANPDADPGTPGANQVFIASASDWAAFANRVNAGETNLSARMTADVVLSQASPFVGDEEAHAYAGTFDGAGHKLTVHWKFDDGTQHVAPFRFTAGATISNLRVAGSLESNGKFVAGFVGECLHQAYNSTVYTVITNCRSSVAITCTITGDSTSAGFVGHVEDSGTAGVRLGGCLFDGSLLGPTATSCGGFIGYRPGRAYSRLYNCLFDPEAVTVSTNDSYTFSRGGADTLSKCYYIQTLGSPQEGTDASSMSAQTLVSNLGGKWTVSNGKASLAAFPYEYEGMPYLSVDLPRTADGATVSVDLGAAAVSAPFPADGDWHHVALALAPSSLVLYVDGSPVATNSSRAWKDLLGTTVKGFVGAATINGKDLSARDGVSIGEILLWNKVLSEDEIFEEALKVHTASENHLAGCYSFVPGTDLEVSLASDARTFTEKVLGIPCTALRCLLGTDGPPAWDSGSIVPDPNTTAGVYVQNDPATTGYNPNEEHAFLTTSGDRRIVWALRADLNLPASSKPGVLVEYVKNGRKTMQWFDVAVTNAAYPALAAPATAGLAFPGPHPIDLLDDPWCSQDSWDEPSTTAPAFRDRKGQLWARAAGTATMRMYYRNQEGFAYPSIDSNKWPSVTNEIPWLSLLGGDPTADPLPGNPAAWTWTVEWPKDVPEMEIGRTLTTAVSGLPEVWNAKSAAIVWPPSDAERDAAAVLFDPTVAQTTGVSDGKTVRQLIDLWGIKSGAGGHATQRKGKWYFDDLPPNLSSRFYLDTSADPDSCLKLIGEKENKPGAVSLLHVNVLSREERNILTRLVDDTAADQAAKDLWAGAIAKLAVSAVRPSTHKPVSTNEETVVYRPRDHYALFSMGATNYITLIENDAPQWVQRGEGDTNLVASGVSAGDPISMHVLKVVPQYYVGPVVTREDPFNLLSQQLSVLYSEAFAGNPDQYVFEWRKARPSPNGDVPTAFDDPSVYTLKFPVTNGLVRFVIGEQGDTLANMVNTYYTVRYRAASPDSPAYAAMSTNWSKWSSPPSLAEGWVQRVLNNVTPFYQRMRDLYDNPAETSVSMIVQAGAPYEGDVALNQDNLTSVGLIQLYETLLSKAESMSLLLGIDDGDANKQLQLAVGRLADMYGVLGDEAWTDALNPTISFGANFDTEAMTGFELDYGKLSSSLFAFDNQVPTLLDEELALLRGRTGDNAPALTISPYYNRLVWNFTRGITAGEVAYAVNYDISGTRSGTIDATQAALQFPQGHGDAYGHYLSALSAYYRLLRNPHFTWGPPAMGELVVNDAVVNADEYDEAHFASVAYDVAKVAAETVDRTARKAFRDNNGATGAGYLDSSTNRNFGYGEWASRGGYGALCNWAVANSLLPAAPDVGRYVRFAFTNRDSQVVAKLLEGDRPSLLSNGVWTVEFQLDPDDPAVDPLAEEEHGHAFPVVLVGETHALEFWFDASNRLSVAAQPMTGTNLSVSVAYYAYTNETQSIETWDKDNYSELAVTNGVQAIQVAFFGSNAPAAFPTNWSFTSLDNPPDFTDLAWHNMAVDDAGNPDPFRYDVPVDAKTRSGDPTVMPLATLPSGSDALVAVVSDSTSLTALVLDPEGNLLARDSVPVPDDFRLGNVETISLGGGFQGEIGELRVWVGDARTTEELHAKREFVSPTSPGLALYLRTLENRPVYAFTDDANSGVQWTVDGGAWAPMAESGMSLTFEDEGLKRIDRGSISALPALADLVPDIQKKLDRLDAGLNPLGLSSGAIPFDLSPVAEGDEGRSHFEQIRERAGTAVANARRILDRAQEAGNRLRLIQEAQSQRDDFLESLEMDYNHRLIEYFGYPYEGDIGPGGTYAQGYDGPDLIHYAWMDLSDYAISSVADTVTATTVKIKGADSVAAAGQNILGMDKALNTNVFTFELSANGLVVKPSNITGKRRAQGQIQEALGEFLCAYSSFNRAKADYDYTWTQLEYELNAIRAAISFKTIREAYAAAKATADAFLTASDCAAKVAKNVCEFTSKTGKLAYDGVINATPTITGAGMTVNVDPSAIVGAATFPANMTAQQIIEAGILAAKNSIDGFDAAGTFLELGQEAIDLIFGFFEENIAWYDQARSAAEAQYEAMHDVSHAYRELNIAQARVETVLAEAERILDERKRTREQSVDILTKMRYSEMFFRLERNQALSRYESAFELAQKYVYLAAQAYDYETGLLSADAASGEAFVSRIVGARTLGEFDDDGEPIPTSDGVKGDGGLASILAEMDANWLVLKPRLGINNPQNYATWFSLRNELFRIYDDERGDENWKTELRKHWVDDLNAVPEFKRYCQPLAGSTADAEPGLVIPFPSQIAFGYNFFGEETVGGDSTLDPTWFATHIAAAGVHFVGYDDSVLAKTPSVYLVPVGADRFRAVGDPDTVLSWNVVDQVIPAPYAIGSQQLDDPDWTPLYNGYTGSADLGAKIRKHPSFRAYYGDAGKDPSDDSLDCTRLVGRSAWNTRWLLIIPAGSLGADRETALGAFVNGQDTNRDGTPDTPGVSDILLGLKTYSHSGN